MVQLGEMVGTQRRVLVAGATVEQFTAVVRRRAAGGALGVTLTPNVGFCGGGGDVGGCGGGSKRRGDDSGGGRRKRKRGGKAGSSDGEVGVGDAEAALYDEADAAKAAARKQEVEMDDGADLLERLRSGEVRMHFLGGGVFEVW